MNDEPITTITRLEEVSRDGDAVLRITSVTWPLGYVSDWFTESVRSEPDPPTATISIDGTEEVVVILDDEMKSYLRVNAVNGHILRNV